MRVFFGDVWYMFGVRTQSCAWPSYLLWWKDLSLGCTRTNSTTNSRMSATELAVDATMDRAGMPSGELGSLSDGHKRRQRGSENAVHISECTMCVCVCAQRPNA